MKYSLPMRRITITDRTCIFWYWKLHCTEKKACRKLYEVLCWWTIPLWNTQSLYVISTMNCAIQMIENLLKSICRVFSFDIFLAPAWLEKSQEIILAGISSSDGMPWSLDTSVAFVVWWFTNKSPYLRKSLFGHCLVTGSPTHPQEGRGTWLGIAKLAFDPLPHRAKRAVWSTYFSADLHKF